MSVAERVPVLMYHRVGEINSPAEARYAIDPQRFANHMHALAGAGLCAVPIADLVAWLEGGPPLPDGAFVLTFDDGFRGVYEHATPVLEALGWPFTVFLISERIGGQDDWMRLSDATSRRYPLLDATEIHAMRRRGCTFHSHTRSHVSLPGLTGAEIENQLAGSRNDLARLLGEDVEFLAYPYGQCDEGVLAATRAAGYRAAFSVRPGFNRRGENLFLIRRLDVFGTDTPAMLLRKVRLGSNDGSLGHAARYYLGRVKQRLAGSR